MASLYLIRHGQASFGSDNYDKLSPLGQRQADVSGEYFTKIGLRFDRAFSGGLVRQRETGERVLAAQGTPPLLQIDPRFNEVDNEGQIAGLLPILSARNPEIMRQAEGSLQNTKQYQKVIQAVFSTWVSPDCPDLADTVSWSDYRSGVQNALEFAMAQAEKGTNTAIFTSGGTIATAVSIVLNCKHDQVYGFYEPIFNCSITRFILSSERVSLSNFNDTAHLQLLSRQLDENLVTYR